MSVLDQILSAPQITSEQHDPNAINVGEAPTGNSAVDNLRKQLDNLRGGGGWWDAAEYGITREAQVARLEESLAKAEAEAATPEGQARAAAAVEAALTEMRQRALNRAQLDTSNGRVNAMYAGQAAWHGLGVVVSKAVNSRQAIDLAGQNWRVGKVQNTYTWNGETRYSNMYSIVREDTGAELGNVGPVYKPIQNYEAFEFLDDILAEFGATYDTAGSLYGGKQVWMLAHLPKQRFELTAGDVNEAYAAIINYHDGSGSAKLFPTSVRLECANTTRVALGGADRVLSIRHTGDIKAKIAAGKQALGVAVRGLDGYRKAAEEMVLAKCPVVPYANAVLDAALTITMAQARLGSDALAAALDVSEAEREVAAKKFESEIKRRENILEDILERYEAGKCRPRGTVWAAYNAVTEHADHRQARRSTKDVELRASRRFESILAGDADRLKQVAYAEATARI